MEKKKKADTLRSRKVRDGKLLKTETISIRLEPRLRYLLELAARKQRRSLTSYFEWVLEDSLNNVLLSGTSNEKEVSINDDASRLWDIDESDRLVRLAILYPELLNSAEQELWKALSVFVTSAANLSPDGEQFWDWNVLVNKVLPRVRKEWPKLIESYKNGKLNEWGSQAILDVMKDDDILQPAAPRAKTKKDFPLKD